MSFTFHEIIIGTTNILWIRPEPDGDQFSRTGLLMGCQARPI